LADTNFPTRRSRAARSATCLSGTISGLCLSRLADRRPNYSGVRSDRVDDRFVEALASEFYWRGPLTGIVIGQAHGRNQGRKAALVLYMPSCWRWEPGGIGIVAFIEAIGVWAHLSLWLFALHRAGARGRRGRMGHLTLSWWKGRAQKPPRMWSAPFSRYRTAGRYSSLGSGIRIMTSRR